MNHLNHAPETNVGRTGAGAAVEPIPATFQYARVKESQSESTAVAVTVPCVLTDGITAQYRVYRPTADPKNLAIDYQIAPDNAPLPPAIPDQATTDPYLLKNAYIGTITVNVPGGAPKVFEVTTAHTDDVSIDLTRGLNVKCSFDFAAVTTSPIGPLLNIELTPVPE